jgi:hypothetical protein
VKLKDLVPVAAALQIQVIRDFAPVWRRRAIVRAFQSLDTVPVNYWPMIVKEGIGYKGQGIHLDKDGSPFSLVSYNDSWSLTASHECLEMLADPLGKRSRTAKSVKPGQGMVRYLVEVCDPCEADEFGYVIEGVEVSDFYYPTYFATDGQGEAQFSHSGAIAEPLEVLNGGYLSWQDIETRSWFQKTAFDDGVKIRELGVFAQGTNPRRATDQQAEIPPDAMSSRRAMMAANNEAAPDGSRHERARYLRSRVKEIVQAAAQ